jgi:hypothetical protein
MLVLGFPKIASLKVVHPLKMMNFSTKDEEFLIS